MNPFDIVKKTPKSNCGQCGYPSCLAFAAAVVKGGEEPGKCPFLEAGSLTPNPAGKKNLAELSTSRDLELIEYLKSKVASLSLAAIAPGLGCALEPGEQGETLLFSYLGRQVRMAKDGILLDGREPDDPRDQILLYNYLCAKGGPPPTHAWIGLESLPNSISKVRTLATYCEDKLAEQFTLRPLAAITEACRALGGSEQPQESATLAFAIPVLPMVPHYLAYWQAEPEDGFPARVKVLFDRRVLDFLDIESLIFAAERMAERLIILLNR